MASCCSPGFCWVSEAKHLIGDTVCVLLHRNFNCKISVHVFCCLVSLFVWVVCHGYFCFFFYFFPPGKKFSQLLFDASSIYSDEPDSGGSNVAVVISMWSPAFISELKVVLALPSQCMQIARNLCCNEHKFYGKTCYSVRSCGTFYGTHRTTAESENAKTYVEDLGEGEWLSARQKIHLLGLCLVGGYTFSKWQCRERS